VVLILDVCIFVPDPPVSKSWRAYWPFSSRRQRKKILLGWTRVSQERQKHFSFVQAKYSLGVTHLCRGCKAADYLLKVLKTFDGSTLCAKHVLVRGSGGMPPLPPLPRNLGSLRANLLAIHISVNCACSQMSFTAHKLCHQYCQTCTKSKSTWHKLHGYTTPTWRVSVISCVQKACQSLTPFKHSIKNLLYWSMIDMGKYMSSQ